MLKYKCLVLDHDDTVVQTTKDIHFPSFKRTYFMVVEPMSMPARYSFNFFLPKHCHNGGFLFFFIAFAYF